MKRSLRQRNQSRRRAKRLSLQTLEKRQLMAGDIGMVDGFVNINGTEMDDVAEVYSDSGSIIVKVSTRGADGQEIGSDSMTFNESEVAGIVFQAGDGDDLFVNDTNVDSITRTGGGNDIVMGGGGNDILAVGMGNDVVLGGGGDDVILGGPGSNVISPAPETAPETDSDAELPVDEEPLADDGVDESPAESELVDEPTDVNNESSPADPTGEDESLTAPESTEDTVIETDTDTMVSDPEQTDDGDVVVEDNFDNENADDEFVCNAHANPDAEAADDPVIQANPEPTEGQTIDGDTAEDESPIDELVVPNDIAPADSSGSDDAFEDAPVDLSDDNDDIDPISNGADLPDDSVATDETDNDVIFGGSGDDLIFGEGGDDLIFGGSSAIDDALLRMVIADRLSLS